MIDSFPFRTYYVIVFELLHINLYRHIKSPGFTGMGKEALRGIATQMLHGLAHLKKIGIIHCDLKPENVMFTDETKTAVKIVDFGSACTDYKSGFTYVQSRFYRCPEILMGLNYDHAADMWSFGCILCELATGRPIFPASDENDLMDYLRVRIGMPPEEMINNCRKKRQFFDKNDKVIRSKKSTIPANTPDKGQRIRDAITGEDDADYINFIEVRNCSFYLAFYSLVLPSDRSREKNDARAGAEASVDQT
jgi:dual specificity tyrosine-phosphorylation-regulated kinase 2/3/4